ncbi:uncharacterized protein BO88DRAFT_236589 [Aspergillus vadensis CBS 113365]|uniref:Uncharacterized protein n=1 Tax=Aspergillus vadensis (strain CBS 113365 / IMI 142717 / IBT 24658) TaxID=1448311 RepID=A0A319BEJ9_ASPVC|nr:hypothetical protein BO88DRAFT_236589 [Aspergillus vadensis CBS 113365]PYH71606.1 hypothetical protein BO88DRAFT_236589 [Aspergillus vadensis CBS 113365]
MTKLMLKCGWAFFAFARSYLLQRKETNRRTIDMEIFWSFFIFLQFFYFRFLRHKELPRDRVSMQSVYKYITISCSDFEEILVSQSLRLMMMRFGYVGTYLLTYHSTDVDII